MGSTDIVIVIAVFVVMSIALLYLSDKVQDCSSLLGSFAQLLSPDIQQKCQKAATYYVYLAFAWVFFGLFATIYIGINIFLKNRFGGIVYSIVMTIVILRLSGVF